MGVKPPYMNIFGVEYSTLHQCKCVQKMWVMALFWILSKFRSMIGSRVDLTLEMDRLDALGQLFPNISMQILRSSKSMIFADLAAFYAIFG